MSDGAAGRLVVVTGGGSGIGAACCRVLAAEGANVAVVDRDPEAARAVASEVNGSAYVLDVADEDAAETCAARIEAERGDISGLVHCAGIVQGRAGVDDVPMRKWDEIVRVDQRGTFVTLRAFARGMLRRRRGAVVAIASVAGMRSTPMHAYAPAKAAVLSMVEGLAAEWGPRSVRVNAVSPGFTLTEGMRKALDAGHMDERALILNSALGRLVDPSEVADAASFLLSDKASAITGINLPVDCGWLVGSPWVAYDGLPESDA